MFISRLVQALNTAQVEYALVGGFAVALHGAVRGTMDVDIVIALTESEFLRTERVLKGLGLEPRLPVDGRQVFQFREEYIKNRNLIAWSFSHPKRPSELVDVVITHDRRKMKVKSIQVHGISYKTASIEDLIQMKLQAGRPQDLADAEALKRIQK